MSLLCIQISKYTVTYAFFKCSFLLFANNFSTSKQELIISCSLYNEDFKKFKTVFLLKHVISAGVLIVCLFPYKKLQSDSSLTALENNFSLFK